MKIMQAAFITVFILFIASARPAQSGDEFPEPMKEQFENSLRYRELQKPVFESILLHDMEKMEGWRSEGIVRISLTRDRSIDGESSLRFRTSLRDEEFLRKNYEENGSFKGGQGGHTMAILEFAEPQDWSRYNRISLWVYVNPTTMSATCFHLSLRCIDAPSGLTAPSPTSFIQDLVPGEWNHVLWEIANLKRDKVTAFYINQVLRGHEPEEEGIVTYDFDRLELQRVDAEKYEGWEVAPGKFSFSHIGYKPEQEKIAIAGRLDAENFQVVDAVTGAAVLTKPVNSIVNERGTFALLDFTELRSPGKYILKAGKEESRSFVIADTVWRQPIYKAINFFYCERCGVTVPGVHRECHRDWQGIHNGKTKIINGGWHDAGDLSQGSFRTGGAIYSMLEIVNQLAVRGTDTVLEERALEEALWGLDWYLKTRFGGGYRMNWSMMRIYTDGITGTHDDVVSPASSTPWENFLAAAVEAYAYCTLINRNPMLAAQCLSAAREDWEAGVEAEGEWTPRGDTHLAASWAITSSIHLFRATGEERFREKAIEYGPVLLACQERRFVDGIPIAGYFYHNRERDSIVHYNHVGFEESPLIALTELCKEFPGHSDWIEWYAAAAIHSEYFLKRGAEYSAPFRMLPNSVFRRSEIMRVTETRQREEMLEQFLDGTRLTDEYYLRTFPIWTGLHGNTNVQLSEAMALTSAVTLRNDLEGAALVDKQLEWVLGRNSFSQSLMYGEGYDYMPQFAYCLRDVIGSLPVGVDCMGNDEPYWSGCNIATYKEIWVVPVSRFLWNAAYRNVPALVTGVITGREKGTPAGSRVGLSFWDKRTGRNFSERADASGNFKALLPEGDYEITCGTWRGALRVVSGGAYSLSIDPGRYINFSLESGEGASPREKRIAIHARGKGNHEIHLRLFNATAMEYTRSVSLDPGKIEAIDWNIQLDDPEIPWVAVIIPDEDMTMKRELSGAAANR